MVKKRMLYKIIKEILPSLFSLFFIGGNLADNIREIIARLKTIKRLIESGILKNDSDALYIETSSVKFSEIISANICVSGGPIIEMKIKNIDTVKLSSLALNK